MPREGEKPTPEREKTDESLRVEREKTDRALSERQAAVEEDADLLVQRARENADAVLSTARHKADRLLETAAAPSKPSAKAPRDVVAQERVIEDGLLRDERATADEGIRREREENTRALSKLLPLERVKTDRFLLTERTRSDDALSHRDDFLGIVSHDLRNLLGGIVTSAALLGKSASADANGQQTVSGANRIQRYAARMNRLIGDLVDVASIDAGRLAFTPAPCDAATLMVEAVETFHASALEKGIALTSVAGEGELVGNFDHDRMLQVLANLITNAIKFTPREGTISIRGERNESELVIRVTDNGQGIPEAMLESIFERFWQVGKNDRRGVGLGLYISRCIVEAHGGKIWAESTVGEGCRLSFTIPSAPIAPPSV